MSLGKDRADKIKKKEAVEQSKRERQLQKAPLLKVKAEALWKALSLRLASEIHDFNVSLADHPERHLKFDPGADSVEIRKSNYSQQHLTAHLILSRGKDRCPAHNDPASRKRAAVRNEGNPGLGS
jgi:hypothetical protein